MANVYIDPFLFACPNIDSTQEIFEDYITALTEWKDLRDNEWINTYILQSTVEVLFRNAKYPIYPDILGLMKKYSIEYVQAGDIVNLVDTYLQRLQIIDDNLQVDDLLVENSKIDVALTDRNVDFLERLYELLNFVAIKAHLEVEHDNWQSILIANYKKSTINYKANLLIIDFKNETEIQCPLEIDSEFNACDRFHTLCKIIKPAEIWVNSDKNSHFVIAVKLNTLKMAIDSNTEFNVDSLSQVTFGVDFIDNLRHLHFMKNTARITILLRSLSETILNIQMAGTHALRVGPGANDVQTTSGKFSGWRRDIDYEYHLHYWKLNRTIIFANIAVHNNFNITPL